MGCFCSFTLFASYHVMIFFMFVLRCVPESNTRHHFLCVHLFLLCIIKSCLFHIISSCSCILLLALLVRLLSPLLGWCRSSTSWPPEVLMPCFVISGCHYLTSSYISTSSLLFAGWQILSASSTASSVQPWRVPQSQRVKRSQRSVWAHHALQTTRSAAGNQA